MQVERNRYSAVRQKKLKKIQRRVRRLSWFPSYQSFSEIGLKGKRDDSERYRYLDYSKCKSKTVIDFGCNLGQTCVKAHKAGARRVLGLDCQKDTIKLAIEIAELLGFQIEYYVVDFNDPNFKGRINEIIDNKKVDISFFLSVYRTKELKDREGLFDYIIDITKEVIFFEGHADPGIDTEDYYVDIFKKFPVEYRFFGYTQNDSRPFFEVYPKKDI